jgi:hypothetical protein
MLKQLKATQHGGPYVDPKDVPDHLKPKKQTKKEKANGSTDSTHFERWDWVLDEMIFAFSTKLDDSADDQFHKGEMDLQWKQLEGGMSQMIKGPNDTHKFDTEGHAHITHVLKMDSDCLVSTMKDCGTDIWNS